MTAKPSYIYLSKIEDVKSEARRQSSRQESLKYSQHLQDAAIKIGALSYHELRARYRKSVDSTPIAKESGDAICPDCDFTFSPEDKDDVRDHRRRHENFDHYYLSTGHRPNGYAARESMKKKGYTLIEEGSELEGWEMVIQSWFDRSVFSYIESGKYKHHPSFSKYAAMIIGNNVAGCSNCKKLVEKYGQKPGAIHEGETYWRPSK
ncbi:hypothetical protein [Halomonas elongata]|uniref:hypothetical protein n=1 Tax=Halomonas elongata TaxID=2746 RepID=UPI004034B98F